MVFEAVKRLEKPLFVQLSDNAADCREFEDREWNSSGGSDWQSIVLSLADFTNEAGVTLADWTGIRELRLGATDTLRQKVGGKNRSLTSGAAWKGPNPRFRNLCWIEPK